eukprot:TRINITY_DN7324_c0_g3_i1.p2 TRINITY_DN7324_c0_g3~~TRINITY_DN7324_c0_g3_i1.p2  ORF type:complete len:143 (-),score=17.06 TRINITY_DN7324_c0_g3_i1:91-519(-)
MAQEQVEGFMKFAQAVKTVGLGACFSLALVAGTTVVQKSFDALGVELDVASQAFAQEKKKKTRKLPGISESTMKKLGVVTELASPDLEKNPNAKPDFPKALRELQKMDKSCKDKCNAYEIAQIYRFYAFVYYSMDDYSTRGR